MAHVNEGSHSFTCHPQVESAILPLLSSLRALINFGSYSFPIPHRIVEVVLGGLVKYWGGLPIQRRSPIPVLAVAAGDQTCNHQVASPMP